MPLFGDMQIELVSYVKMCPNFKTDADKWTCAGGNAEEKIISQYNLLSKMDTIRVEHLHYISELARYNNEVSSSNSMNLSNARSLEQECFILTDIRFYIILVVWIIEILLG